MTADMLKTRTQSCLVRSSSTECDGNTVGDGNTFDRKGQTVECEAETVDSESQTVEREGNTDAV